MNTNALADLAAEWRGESEVLRRRGASAQADVLDSVARDLEERLREWELEALTMEEAQVESGYSRSTLERRMASGQIPNVGKGGAPRILRRDLPFKGGRQALGTRLGEPDLAGLVLSGPR